MAAQVHDAFGFLATEAEDFHSAPPVLINHSIRAAA